MVTITDARVYVEVPRDSTTEQIYAFVRSRVGDGSQITECVFRTFDSWAGDRTAELLNKSAVVLDDDNGPLRKPRRKWHFWKTKETP